METMVIQNWVARGWRGDNKVYYGQCERGEFPGPHKPVNFDLYKWREVTCKRTHQLSTLLWPAVLRGKDTTHKTLKTMCHARAWPQQCWKSCANGSNIVALRFVDHGTKEMFWVIGSRVWSVSNFAQQLSTTQQHAIGCANRCDM